MMNFDDEVLATVRALSATVGVPEHLPAAAAGRARRADILDRGFVPRVLTAFDVARGDATRRPLLRRYVSALMHLAGGGAVECRRLVAMPEFLAFLRTALGDIPSAPEEFTSAAAFDLEVLVLLGDTVNFMDDASLEALGPTIAGALVATLVHVPLLPVRRAPVVVRHADPAVSRAGFVALAAFVDNPMPSNVYDPAACVATRCPAAKAIERAADAVTIASAKELNGMVAVAETTLRYWYDPVCHLLAQKAANNVSSLVLRAIPWSPAVHSLFPRGPRAIVRTVLLATARGAVAVPFDVVVSKILPFAITLQRGRTSRSYAAFGGSDDDEHFRDDDGDADDDGSIAELTVRRCVKINFRRPTRWLISTQAVLSAAAVGGSDDDGSLSSAADDAAAA